MRALVLLSALLAAVMAGQQAPHRAYSSGSHGRSYGYSLPSGHARFTTYAKSHHYAPRKVTKYVHKPVVKVVEVPKVIVKEVPKYVVKEVPRIVIKEVPKVVERTVEVPRVVVKHVPVTHEVRVAAPVSYTQARPVVPLLAPAVQAVRVAPVAAAQFVAPKPTEYVAAHDTQYVAPAAVTPVPVAVAAAPVAVGGAFPYAGAVNSQFHAQDELGQYDYGYSNPSSSKQEVKTADGIVRGGFSYVDANGQTQVASYYSDALGFHIARTDLPVAPVAPAAAVPAGPAAVAETAEVAAARAEHLSAHAAALEAGEQAGSGSRRRRSLAQPLPLGYSAALSPLGRFGYAVSAPSFPYVAAPIQPAVRTLTPGAQYAYGAPVAAYAAPYAYAAPVSHSAQFHAQDELGQYNYGYQGGPSAKQEVRTADGLVRGSYTYVDANGLPQTATYYSDALGFHVARTDLPVAPVDAGVAPVDAGVAPQPVQDTPEVAAAKVAHAKAHADALAAASA